MVVKFYCNVVSLDHTNNLIAVYLPTFHNFWLDLHILYLSSLCAEFKHKCKRYVTNLS